MDGVFGVPRPPSSRGNSRPVSRAATPTDPSAGAFDAMMAAEERNDYQRALQLRLAALEDLAAKVHSGRASPGLLVCDGEEYIRRLNFYALSLLNAKRFGEAGRYLTQALKMLAMDDSAARPVNVFSDADAEHVVLMQRCTATTQNNFGLLHYKAGRLQEAEGHFFAAARAEEAIPGFADNPAATLLNLAVVQNALGKFAHAAECARAAAAHAREQLDDPQMLVLQRSESRAMLIQCLLLAANAATAGGAHAKAAIALEDARDVAKADVAADSAAMLEHIQRLVRQNEAAAARKKALPPGPRRPSKSREPSPSAARAALAPYYRREHVVTTVAAVRSLSPRSRQRPQTAAHRLAASGAPQSRSQSTTAMKTGPAAPATCAAFRTTAHTSVPCGLEVFDDDGDDDDEGPQVVIPIRVPSRPTTAGSSRGARPSTAASSSRSVPSLSFDDDLLAEYRTPAGPTTVGAAGTELPAAHGAARTSEDLLVAAAEALARGGPSHVADGQRALRPPRPSSVFRNDTTLRAIYTTLSDENRAAFDALASCVPTVDAPRPQSTQPAARPSTAPARPRVPAPAATQAARPVSREPESRGKALSSSRDASAERPPTALPSDRAGRATGESSYSRDSSPVLHSTGRSSVSLHRPSLRETTHAIIGTQRMSGSPPAGGKRRTFAVSKSSDLVRAAVEHQAREIAAEVIQAAGWGYKARLSCFAKHHQRALESRLRDALRVEVRAEEQRRAEQRAQEVLQEHERQLEARRLAIAAHANAHPHAGAGHDDAQASLLAMLRASIVQMPAVPPRRPVTATASPTVPTDAGMHYPTTADDVHEACPQATDPQAVEAAAGVAAVVSRQRDLAQRMREYQLEQQAAMDAEERARADRLRWLRRVQAHLRARLSVRRLCEHHTTARTRLLEDYAQRRLVSCAEATLRKHAPLVATLFRERKAAVATRKALLEHRVASASVVSAHLHAVASVALARTRRDALAAGYLSTAAAFVGAAIAMVLRREKARAAEARRQAKMDAAAAAVQRAFRFYLAQKQFLARLAAATADIYRNRAHYAATLIQATYKMHRYGRPVRPLIAEHSAELGRRALAEARLLRQRAVAPVLQRAYRCHLARRAAAFLHREYQERRREYLSFAMRDYAARVVQRFSRIVAAKAILRNQRCVMKDMLAFRAYQRHRILEEATAKTALRIAIHLVQRAGRAYHVRQKLRRYRVERVAVWDALTASGKSLTPLL